MFHGRDKLVEMDLKQLCRLEVMTPEEHMPAEREPATPRSRVCVVFDQDRVTVVCQIATASPSAPRRPASTTLRHSCPRCRRNEPTARASTSSSSTKRWDVDSTALLVW